MTAFPDTLAPPESGVAADHHHGDAGTGTALTIAGLTGTSTDVAILGELRALNAKIDDAVALVASAVTAADQFRPVLESIVSGLASHPLLSRFIRL